MKRIFIPCRSRSKFRFKIVSLTRYLSVTARLVALLLGKSRLPITAQWSSNAWLYSAVHAVSDAAVAQDSRRGGSSPQNATRNRGNVGRNTGLDAVPAEMAEKEAANRDEARSPGEGVSVEQVTGAAQLIPPPARQSTRKRRLLMGVLGALVLAAAGIFGIPWIRLTLNTVSTDDAYVNGHVTFVPPASAARLRGFWWMTIAVCTKEIFAPNWTKSHIRSPSPGRERRSTLRKRTCRRPQRWCAVSKHKPGAGAGNCKARLRTSKTKIALLHDRVAAFDKSKATLTLAQVEFDRAKQLLASGTASRQEYDRRQEALSTAGAQVTQALAAVHRVRASLGLPPQPDRGEDLSRPISISRFLLSSRHKLTLFRVRLSSVLSIRMARPQSKCSTSSKNRAISTALSPSSRRRLRPSSRPRLNSKPPTTNSLRLNWTFVTVTSLRRLMASSRVETSIQEITFKLARI